MSENSGSSGAGCFEIVLIVLIVLWLVGYWDKPKVTAPMTEPSATAPVEAVTLPED